MSDRKKNGGFKIPAAWPVKDPSRYAMLDKFRPYPQNPRTHPQHEIDLLAKALAEFGPDQPIVVDEKWVIIKGHGRRIAATQAGLTHFTYEQRHGLTDDQKRAMRIADNAIPLLAGWDFDLLRLEIAPLQASGYDLDLLAFSEAQRVEFMSSPQPPANFQAYGDDIPTDYCCPKCGYVWSGNPKPTAEPEDKKPKAKAKKK